MEYHPFLQNPQKMHGKENKKRGCNGCKVIAASTSQTDGAAGPKSRCSSKPFNMLTVFTSDQNRTCAQKTNPADDLSAKSGRVRSLKGIKNIQVRHHDQSRGTADNRIGTKSCCPACVSTFKPQKTAKAGGKNETQQNFVIKRIKDQVPVHKPFLSIGSQHPYRSQHPYLYRQSCSFQNI